MCQAVGWSQKAEALRKTADELYFADRERARECNAQAQWLEDRIAHWLSETFSLDVLEAACGQHWQAASRARLRAEEASARREHNALMNWY